MSASDEQPIPVGIGIIRREDRFLVRRRPAGTVYAGLLGVSRRQVRARRDPGRGDGSRMPRGDRTGRSSVGPLRRITTYRYPHGLVELHFYDCTTENPAAEPRAESGFVWVRAGELRSLRFPEANEHDLSMNSSGPRRHGTGLG